MAGQGLRRTPAFGGPLRDVSRSEMQRYNPPPFFSMGEFDMWKWRWLTHRYWSSRLNRYVKSFLPVQVNDDDPWQDYGGEG